MKCLAAVAIWVLLAGPVEGQNVLSAEPLTRVHSSSESATRERLSDVDRAKNRVIIVRDGNRFLWASREGRELVHVVSGVFHYFLDKSGTGYVKVMDTQLIPAATRPKGPRYLFMEHVSIWLGTITYWGESDTFDLGVE